MRIHGGRCRECRRFMTMERSVDVTADIAALVYDSRTQAAAGNDRCTDTGARREDRGRHRPDNTEEASS